MSWGRKKTLPDEANILLEIHLGELGLEFGREFKFDLERNWRFDYLLIIPDRKVAIEIEGGLHAQGRHVRGAGYERDLEKYNAATAAGFEVYRFSTQQVLDGRARAFIAAKVCGVFAGIEPGVKFRRLPAGTEI